MNPHGATGAANDFSRVSTFRKALPEYVRQEYDREIKPLIRELHALLPHLRKRVSAAHYAKERDELMLLTACFCDDSLDIYALEALVRHLKWCRRIFVTALAEPPATV